jgi:hypothetical protein
MSFTISIKMIPNYLSSLAMRTRNGRTNKNQLIPELLRQNHIDVFYLFILYMLVIISVLVIR